LADVDGVGIPQFYASILDKVLENGGISLNGEGVGSAQGCADRRRAWMPAVGHFVTYGSGGYSRMGADGPTDAEITQTLAKVGELSTNLRGKLSPESAKSTAVWLVLVLAGALVDEFAQLDPEQRAWFFAVIRDKVALVLAIPGAKLGFEIWRRDK
jgi:hypothetical protein